MKVDSSDFSNIIPILGHDIRNSSRLKRFGTWLISPSLKYLQPDKLRQSRLLGAMLTALIMLGVPAEALSLVFGSDTGIISHILTTLFLVCLGTAFLLNRAGYFTLAAWMTVATLSISIYGLTFITDSLPINVDFLIYLVLPFIFACVFFSERMIGILAAIFIGGSLFAAFIPGVNIMNLVLGPVSFMAMACGIVYVIFHQRNIMELDRGRELMEKEERYRTLLETSYEGICIISGGMILDANPNFARMLGFELSELMGKPVGGRLPVEMYTNTSTLMIGHEGQLSMMPIVRKDGTSFHIEAVSRMQTYRGEIAQVIAIRNITERVQAEAALDHNERLYRSLFEGANDAIFLVGFNDIYIKANQKAADLLGYSVHELIGKPVKDVVVEREYPNTLAKKNELLSGGDISLYERVFLKQDGSEFPAEVNISLVRDRDDQPLFIQSIVRDITERKQIEARIQLQLERLNALREIDKMITGSLDLKATLTILLKQAETQLGISAADILLFNPPSENLEVFAELGFGSETPPRGAVDRCEPLAGRAASEGRLVSILELSASMQDCPRIGSLISQGFKAGFAVPLIAKGEVKGILEVFQRQPFQPSSEWLDFLETLGGQAAIAVDSYELFQSLQRSNMDLVQAYDATLEGWAKALEMRDEETEGHSHRVVDMTVSLGRENGYSDANLVHLRRGALLHDIGKLSIPDSILLKPGALTVEEWKIMKMHPVYATQMLSEISFLNLASDIPSFHHEKWDGSGYPDGLQGEEIPLAARLFAIVDVWDALTSDRPYRRAWTKEKALDYISHQKGKHFDPKVVDQFFDLVEKP